MRKAISIISGGADSVANGLRLLKQGYHVSFLHIPHGQKAELGEESACRRIVKWLKYNDWKCNLYVIPQLWLGQLGGSGLTDKDISVPDGLQGVVGSTMQDIFTPARNVVLIATAAALAESIGAEVITLGCNQSEAGQEECWDVKTGEMKVKITSGYPDNSKEFLDRFTSVLELGCLKVQPKVISPEWEMDKVEIYKWVFINGFGELLKYTWSCDSEPYHIPDTPPHFRDSLLMCGRCGCCIPDDNVVWAKKGLVKPSDVRIGDDLLSFNEETREVEWSRVTELFIRESVEYYMLTIQSQTDKRVLKITGEHPIYINRDGHWQWIEAKNVKVGDIAYSAGHKAAMVCNRGDRNVMVRYPELNPMNRPKMKIKWLDKVRSEEHGKALSDSLKQSEKVQSYMRSDRNPMRRYPDKNPMKNLDFRGSIIQLNSDRMTLANPMKDPEIAAKAGRSNSLRIKTDPASYQKMLKLVKVAMRAQRHLRPNHVEEAYINLNLPIKYIGNRQLEVSGFFPDFIVEGKNKLIEVHHPIWCKLLGLTWDEWKEQRHRAYESEGYESLFLSAELPIEEGARQIKDFINNGFKITGIEKVEELATVYNYECRPNNNYYVNGVLVHNCRNFQLTFYILNKLHPNAGYKCPQTFVDNDWFYQTFLPKLKNIDCSHKWFGRYKDILLG